jgi:hypothetical protein
VYTPTNLELYFLELVNQLRAKVGAKPLSFDGELLKSADAHSAWMDKTDTISHTGVNGTKAGDRMTSTGYGWQAWGENIAFRGGPLNEETVRLLHDQLVKSPTHYANLIKGTFSEIGIGLKLVTYGGYTGVVVTQKFGSPDAAEAAEGNDVGNPNVTSSLSYTLPSRDAENLTLSGNRSINGTGNSLDNVLSGNSGANTLKGLAGNDSLDGKGGKDVLTGGSGYDAFVFGTSKEANGDTVTDFREGADKLVFTKIDANVRMKGNQAFSFIGEEAFHNLAGELRAYGSGGKNYVTGDTNGDGIADFTIRVSGSKTFGSSDFVL